MRELGCGMLQAVELDPGDATACPALSRRLRIRRPAAGRPPPRTLFFSLLYKQLLRCRPIMVRPQATLQTCSGTCSGLTRQDGCSQPPRRRAQRDPAALADVAMDEPEVAALSQAQRDRLLRAFDTAGQSSAVSSPRKGDEPERRRRKWRRVGVVESPPSSDDEGGFLPAEFDEAGGGFLTAEDDVNEGGGFILADDEAGPGGFVSTSPPADARGEAADDAEDERRQSTKTHLPLSLVSAALRLAGLPPSDPEVLEFFRQSAEGWMGEDADVDHEATAASRHDFDDPRGVSRKDWMSVCAVLLASRAEEDNDVEPEGPASDEDTASSDLSEAEEDEYLDEAGLDPELNLGDPTRRRTRRTTRSAARLSPAPSLLSDDSDETEDDSDGVVKRPSGSGRLKGAGGKMSQHVEGKRSSKASRGSVVASGGRPELLRGEKRTAREAFALFFPPGTGPAVDDKVLTVGMVAAVVKDLKETHVSADLVRGRMLPPPLSRRCSRSSSFPPLLAGEGDGAAVLEYDGQGGTHARRL